MHLHLALAQSTKPSKLRHPVPLQRKNKAMAGINLSNLEAQVTRIEGVVPSVIAIINAYAAEILANKDDANAIEALSGRMTASADALANAAAANPGPTPA